MIDEEKIEKLYKGIRCTEEVDLKEIEENLKENIVAIYLVMDKFEEELCCRMQERVVQVKEYITRLEKLKR